MMKPKISVIVPVYNVEPYLKRCLDSIINQSMNEIEILVIDDGSTDGSGKICDEYAKLDNRIRVIHQVNGGLSHARNVGLDIAQGKYVMFVDSDDYVDKYFCQIPYEIAKHYNCDIVIFCTRTLYKGVELEANKTLLMEGEISKQEAFNNLTERVRNSVWNKLFVKELFDDIAFPEGRYHEDVFVLYKLLLKANSIYYSHSFLYNYMRRDDGLTSLTCLKKRFDCLESFYEQMHNIIESGYDYEVSFKSFKRALKYLICFGFNDRFSDECVETLENFRFKKETFKLHYWIMLFICLNCRTLFNLICVIFDKRNNIKFYTSKFQSF